MQITANFDVILRNIFFCSFLYFFGVKIDLFLSNKENLEHLNIFRRHFLATYVHFLTF